MKTKNPKIHIKIIINCNVLSHEYIESTRSNYLLNTKRITDIKTYYNL